MAKREEIKRKLERGLSLNLEINAEKQTKKITESRLDALYKTQQEISECIHKIENPVYRTLLIERYINCKKWEQIAEDMNYELSSVYKLHKKAVDAICKSGY